MFREAYAGIEEHLKWGRWHVEVDMWKGSGGSPSNYRVTSLQAFWPAVQAGAGDLRAAERTYDSLLDLWKEHEALPDFYDVLNGRCVCFVCVFVFVCACVCVYVLFFSICRTDQLINEQTSVVAGYQIRTR